VVVVVVVVVVGTHPHNSRDDYGRHFVAPKSLLLCCGAFFFIFFSYSPAHRAAIASAADSRKCQSLIPSRSTGVYIQIVARLQPPLLPTQLSSVFIFPLCAPTVLYVVHIYMHNNNMCNLYIRQHPAVRRGRVVAVVVRSRAQASAASQEEQIT
jgi:hypothetical protein